MHHKRGHIDCLEVLGEISLRKCLDAVVVGLDSAHHSLTPPVVSNSLGYDGSRAVVAVEGQGEVYIVLGSVEAGALADLVEDFDGCSARVLVGLDHDGGNCTDE